LNIDLIGWKLIDNEENTGSKVKDYRLDIKLEKGNEIVIIEMNKDYYEFLENKNYQYLYRVAGSMYDKGEEYSNKKVKLIIFNNFKNKEIKELKIGNFKMNDRKNNLVIEDIESFEIYLPNFKEMCYHNANKEDVSISLFTCMSYEEMRRHTKNEEDIKIIEELERLSMNEDFIVDYDQEAVFKKTQNSIRLDGYHEGVKEGLEEGLKEGLKEKTVEIAKSMLNDNQDINIISKYTGLTQEEVNNLK